MHSQGVQDQYKRVTNSCIVPGCTDKISSRRRFPKKVEDDDIYRIWLKRINNPKLFSLPKAKVYSTYFVCSSHFEDDCFEKFSLKRKLKKRSLPTLFLPNYSPGDSDDDWQELASVEIDLPSTNEDHQLVDDADILLNSFETIDTQETLLSTLFGPYNQSEEMGFLNKPLENQENNTTANVESNSNACHLEETEDQQVNDYISDTIRIESEEPVPVKPYFRSVKSYLLDTHCITEVCRVCFCSIIDEDMVKLYEDKEETKKIKKILTLVLPDLDLEMYPNSVICVKCVELLLYSYELKEKWLTTEDKLQKIIERKKGVTRKDADLVIVAKVNVSEEVPSGSNTKNKTNGITKQVLQDILSCNEPNTSTEEITTFDENIDTDIFPTELPSTKDSRRKKKSELGPGPYVCDRCGKLYETLTTFRYHMRTHTSDTNEFLSLHLDKLPKKQSVMCDQCGDIFTSLREFRTHISVHKAKHKCELCGKFFKYNGLLQQHIKVKHLKLYNYCQCHICGKKLAQRNSLNTHLRTHYPKKFSCQICEKKFLSPYFLRIHLRSHDNSTIECEYCGKKVKNQWSLQKHIRIFHENRREFVCDVCDRSYSSTSALKRHKRRVHR